MLVGVGVGMSPGGGLAGRREHGREIAGDHYRRMQSFLVKNIRKSPDLFLAAVLSYCFHITDIAVVFA